MTAITDGHAAVNTFVPVNIGNTTPAVGPLIVDVPLACASSLRPTESEPASSLCAFVCQYKGEHSFLLVTVHCILHCSSAYTCPLCPRILRSYMLCDDGLLVVVCRSCTKQRHAQCPVQQLHSYSSHGPGGIARQQCSHARQQPCPCQWLCHCQWPRRYS